MSGTTKRTVSRKKIVPVLKPEPVVKTFNEVVVETTESDTVIAATKPLLKLKATMTYSNFAISNGISVKPGDIINVDFLIFQQLMRDNPHAFERV